MKYILFALFFVFSAEIAAQTVLEWTDFERGISWRKSDSKSTSPGFLEADFSNKLEDLEGKKIVLAGFLIVLEGPQAVYMLSKNPMAQCFFCGNGGPETIAQISFSGENSFQMDDLVSVTGILRLNGDDPTRCYYSIEEAEALSL